MDLWIRSQDKTDLRKLRKVVYLEPGISFNLPSGETIECDNYSIMVDGYCLGIYKTQERALEVLDEIQRYLDRGTIISPRRITDYEKIKKQFDDGFIITDGSIDITPCDVIVYEMPKD